jgi:hypothetical protein
VATWAAKSFVCGARLSVERWVKKKGVLVK